jgi:lipid-binding SYLF domain-containing protein
MLGCIFVAQKQKRAGYTMTQFNRRGLAMLIAGAALAGCSNGIGNRFNQNASGKIDARVERTLQTMYSEFPTTAELAQKSSGMLVMPLITEAGFGYGGGYGRGALLINGETVDYYSTTFANIGLQIGAQQYAHVLFFMTQESLEQFRSSEGWAAGGDIEYAFPKRGESLRAETTTALSEVVAYVFGHSGLKLGVTLEGAKYTRIIP